MADTISFPPSPASSSPSLGHDAPEASQSSRTDYVLPPIPIDATPISQLLPLAFTELAHELYEAKAPPPLPLPPLLACPEKYDEEHAHSAASLTALPPSPSSSATSLVDHPPPESRAAVVPRCVPPRSNAHTAFPSPPPSPTLSDSPAATSRPKANTRPNAPLRPPAQRLGRRHLAPAFVRGECLPFAIAEEDESEEPPSTSASEYSAESAVRVAGGGAGATTTTTTTSAVAADRARALSGGGFWAAEALSPDAEPERPWRSVPMEKRCSAKKKKASFRTRVHRVMLVGPALSLRSRLRL